MCRGQYAIIKECFRSLHAVSEKNTFTGWFFNVANYLPLGKVKVTELNFFCLCPVIDIHVVQYEGRIIHSFVFYINSLLNWVFFN